MKASIEQAIAAIHAGQMIIVTDAADRENEGDLIMAAERVTPADINFMSRESRGLICLALTRERAQALELSPMVPTNTSLHHTNFTVSIDSRHGITTGISATERAKTIADVLNDATRPDDLCRPGHMFPIVAHDDGLLARAGHTEAAVTLAELAGLKPAGVICEILDDNGNSCRGEKLTAFAARHNLMIISIAELTRHLQQK